MTVIKIYEIKNLGEIAACYKNHCLYIFEISKGIWKLQMTQTQLSLNKNYRLSVWFIASIVHNPGMCATTEGHVLLSKGKPLPSLDLFDQNALLMKTILLPVFMREPCYALATPMGQFIVSFGCNPESVHGVCVIDENGQVVCGYDPTLQWQCLRHPSHLAIGREGSLFLTDVWNSRVIKLDEQLHFKQVVISGQDGLQDPFNPSVNSENNQLISLSSNCCYGWKHGCRSFSLT